MIIKTALNPNAGNLYRHLTRTDDGNEKVRLVEVRGCVSTDLLGSLREMKATAAGSRCEKSLYHVSFAAPLADANQLQSDEIWLRCADRLEQEFGLEGHARAVVHHFKDGRWHQHVVWNRIDPDTGLAAHLSHEHRRAIKVARELERELHLTPVSNERRPERAAQRPPQPWEMEAARRTKVDADQVRDQIRAAWQQSDTGHSFAAALADQGLLLAKGDVRPYVVLDSAGNFFAVSGRVLPGENARSIRDRLVDVHGALPTLEQGRAIQAEHDNGLRHRRGGKGGKGERGQGGKTGTRDQGRDFAAAHVALKRELEKERTALEKKQAKERAALGAAHARELAKLDARKLSWLAKITGAAKRQRAKDEAARRQVIAEQEAQRTAHLRALQALQQTYNAKAAALRAEETRVRSIPRQLGAAPEADALTAMRPTRAQRRLSAIDKALQPGQEPSRQKPRRRRPEQGNEPE